MLTLFVTLGLAALVQGQLNPGSGPRPAALTTSVPPGTWSASPSLATPGLPDASLGGMSRQIQLNSADDFCLLMPPRPTEENLVDAEADAVAYCTKPRNGTRPMPDGFILSAHYRKTSEYVQISGSYNPGPMHLASGPYGHQGARLRSV